MKTSQHTAPMQNLAVLARLVERMESSKAPFDPAQYQTVVRRLAAEFDQALPEAVEALLEMSPTCAELYENLHYDQAGLCRHSLEAAVAAEAAAKAAIDQARARAA